MTRRILFPDPWVVLLGLAATLLGLFFVFDAGYARSLSAGRGVLSREFLGQLVPLFIGLGLAAWLARANPTFLKRWTPLIWLASFVSLLLPKMPFIGKSMNGAERWIKLGPLPMVQPAEFTKVAAILFLAAVFASRKAWPTKIKSPKSFADWSDRIAIPKLVRCWPAFFVLAAVFLIEKEPDMGTAAVVAAVAFAMFVVGGVTQKTLVVGALLACLGVGVMLKSEPYRMERFRHHFSRWSDQNIDDMGYQTVQSEFAMASGGLFGVGPGAGRAKHVLPAATTDFVLATIGEEFGFLGPVVVLSILAALVFRLLYLAKRAQDRFSYLVLYGIASWIGIQAAVNVMMANGLLPAIGIPLPFISSGGSSLVALWIAIGVSQAVLNPIPEAKEERDATGRHRWRNRRARFSGA